MGEGEGEELKGESTVRERSQTLVSDFELKGFQEGGGIVQNGDVGDVHSTHSAKIQTLASAIFIEAPDGVD